MCGFIQGHGLKNFNLIKFKMALSDEGRKTLHNPPCPFNWSTIIENVDAARMIESNVMCLMINLRNPLGSSNKSWPPDTRGFYKGCFSPLPLSVAEHLQDESDSSPSSPETSICVSSLLVEYNLFQLYTVNNQCLRYDIFINEIL